jgi:hypothetical protein
VHLTFREVIYGSLRQCCRLQQGDEQAQSIGLDRKTTANTFLLQALCQLSDP